MGDKNIGSGFACCGQKLVQIFNCAIGRVGLWDRR
jgi:hypothetical protein